MKRTVISSAAAAAIAALLLWTVAQAVAPEQAPAAPQFTHQEQRDWINSEPLKLKDLRGQVVLLDFWTFACWNCYRSFPWLNALEHSLEDEAFTVIGVHSPEFDYEKDRERIKAKVKEFMLEHPIMIDSDHSYWRAMGNRYWPAFYLIDKQGRVRNVFVGETHKGDPRARRIEAAIADLLNEEPPT